MTRNLLITILHLVSLINGYVLSFITLFIIQSYILANLLNLKSILILDKFYLYEILSISSSLFFVYKYVSIETPYKKYLNR